MSDLFPERPTPTPIGDAIDRLGASGEGFELETGRDARGDPHVRVEGTKVFGKDKTWSASGAVAWAKATGYAVLGKLRWTPK